MVLSEARMQKVAETYRLLRNTLRYQLSNLYDFDPARHAVPDEHLTGLDRWILGEFARLETEVAKAYDACEFHLVYQKLSQFAAVELSAIYHDVVKDRLYTDPAGSPRRRSTQTALHRMVTSLCQMLSPMLAFTADEAWEYIPGKPAESVHLSLWKPKLLTLPETEQAAWQNLFALREAALPELEKARQAKLIGKALEAAVTLTGRDARLEAIDSKLKPSLAELLNVSRLEVRPDGASAEELRIQVTRADGQKCERCWHWETDVAAHAEHPTLCSRCVAAVTPLA
jgi:isoleucyl-tRNA synthetase